MLALCYPKLMLSDLNIRLFQAQQNYDELENELLGKRPAFRQYLDAKDQGERARCEQSLLSDPDFLRLRAIVAEINDLYDAGGGIS
jgi:hypothetical protein